jgi:hypothetical protein
LRNTTAIFHDHDVVVDPVIKRRMGWVGIPLTTVIQLIIEIITKSKTDYDYHQIRTVIIRRVIW